MNKYEPLLTRMEKLDIQQFQKEENDMPEDNINTINIDQFTNIDLRVAKIINAEEIAEADKLIKLTLSVGELGEKTVFAGIKSAYALDGLQGKYVVVVNNLKPRQMKFGLSEGMILAAGPGGEDVFMISPDQGAEPGMRVK